MGRLRDVWRVLTGKASAPGMVDSGVGLLAGVLQAGQMARRGTPELAIAYRRLPWLRSVGHRIAHDCAAIPFRLYQPAKGSAKAFKGVAGAVRRSLMEDAKRAGDLREIDSHPFLDLMARWNPALRAHASRVVVQLWLDIKGEVFSIKERNGLGAPLELWPIPPHWVTEIPRLDWPYFRAQYLGWNRILPETEMAWWRHPDPLNPYARGIGLGESLADNFDVAEQATQHIRDWFFNRGKPAGIVNLPGAGEDILTRARAEWEQKYQGPGKSNRLHFTNAENMSVQDLSQTFVEQEVVALTEQQRDVVMQVFNVPPECMGVIENSNRATIDAAYTLYAMGVLCPRMDFLVDSLGPLLEEFDSGLILDYANPVPADKEFKHTVFASSPSGTFTRNEQRALAGMPPVEGGDEEAKQADIYQYHFQFGIVTINEARARLGLPPLPDGDKPPDPLLMGGAPTEMAADPTWVKDLRPRAVLKQGVDLESILAQLEPTRLSDELGPLWEERMKKWGERALSEVGVGGSFNMRNPLIRQHLDALGGERVSLINETTREALRTSLGEGVAAGEGIAELTQRVLDVFGVASESRAENIARTEVVGSSNFANLQAYEQSGVVAAKEWLSVPDGETRDTHRALNGRVVGLREMFSANGKLAPAPGQFGDPSEDCNCRCSVLPVVDEPGKSHKALTEAEKLAAWKAFDRRLVSWERAAAKALRRGFKRQCEDVLTALR